MEKNSIPVGVSLSRGEVAGSVGAGVGKLSPEYWGEPREEGREGASGHPGSNVLGRGQGALGLSWQDSGLDSE